MESQEESRESMECQEITSASSSLFQFAHAGISTYWCSPARVGVEKSKMLLNENVYAKTVAISNLFRYPIITVQGSAKMWALGLRELAPGVQREPRGGIHAT